MKLTERDFEYEEDYAIAYECDNCGHYEDSDDEECSECYSDVLIYETSHEGLECDLCEHIFDPWEDWYVFDPWEDWRANDSDKDTRIEHICENCYSDLPVSDS